MEISAQSPSAFTSTARDARALVRTITSDGMTLEPEKTEEEIRLESSTLSFQKQLTPEEENRVLFLQNLLAQTLAMAEGNPTEEQRSRIREIEKELEKITGVKVRSSLSATTKNLPGKDEDEDKEEGDLEGIDPKEAAHSRQPDYTESDNPGMQMLQRRAAMLSLGSALEDFKGMSGLSAG